MSDDLKKHLAYLMPDLGDEKNPDYDFSNIGLAPYSENDFLPYFVVYRESIDSPLLMYAFLTLHAAYVFIFEHYKSWYFYTVGSCLESYTSKK